MANKLNSSILLQIRTDLSAHKRDNSDLLQYYISKRLNKSLEAYADDLQCSRDILSRRDLLKIAKNLNRN